MTDNVIIVTLLVLLVATNAYWCYLTNEILEDWSDSTGRWVELTDELLDDLKKAETDMRVITDRIWKGGHT